MSVYVEYAILDNFFADSLLLFAVFLSKKQTPKFSRIFLGAFVGTIVALINPFVVGVWNLLVKLLGFLLIVFCTFGKNKFLQNSILFFTYTFLLGGVIIGVFFLTDVQFDLSNGIYYQQQIPLGVWFFALFVFLFACWCLHLHFSKMKVVASFLQKATIRCDDFLVNVQSFLDSGNTLIVEGFPVCFALGNLNEKLKKEIASDVLKKKKVFRVNYSTVDGEKKTVAKKCFIETDSCKKECLLAVSQGNKENDFDVILNSQFFKGGQEC